MIVEAVEGSVLSAEQWCDKLSCTPSDLDRLIAVGALRAQPDGVLRLRLVGVAVTANSVLVSRPAVRWALCEKSISQFVRTLGALLAVYRERSLRRGVSVDSIRRSVHDQRMAQRTARAIELFETLVALTAAYGFHEVESRELASEEYGRIDWNGTIARSLAMHGRSGVVYPNPRTHAVCSRVSCLGILQAIALQECDKRFGRLMHDADPSAVNLIEEARALVCENMEMTRDASIVVDAAASVGNRDHEHELLSVVTACYEGLAGGRGNDELASLWGTTAFNLVWEDVCRFAAGVGDPPTLRRSEPVYNIRGRTFETVPQRPDLVFEEQDSLFLCDAKYYPLFPATFPGLEDVRKQVFYGLSSHMSSVVLSFLLPGRVEGIVERVGSVRMESNGKTDARFGEVHCLLVDWEELCSVYVGRRPRFAMRALIAAVCTHS
jgi:hypothetical protein